MTAINHELWPRLTALRKTRSIKFWLRDDDAVADTEPLRRLLGMELPLLLAVIPLSIEPSLVDLLAGRQDTTVAMHGIRHENHAPAGRKAEELAIERGFPEIDRTLAAGRARLMALFGASAVRWYVPPWNRIDPAVARRLAAHEFELLSTFAGAHLDGACPLAVANCQVDIIDWRNGRIGRTRDWVDREIARQIELQGDAGEPLIGILTHHLVHDATAWSVIEELAAMDLDWVLPDDVARRAAARRSSASG